MDSKLCAGRECVLGARKSPTSAQHSPSSQVLRKHFDDRVSKQWSRQLILHLSGSFQTLKLSVIVSP